MQKFSNLGQNCQSCEKEGLKPRKLHFQGLKLFSMKNMLKNINFNNFWC